MADVFTKEKRSEVMSKIRGQGNKNTELALIKLFREKKIVGWRRRQKVFGKPDFVFPAKRIAVFVDGCFWHACPQHCQLPLNNRGFWKRKLERNRMRDVLVNKVLKQGGWKVIRIWECQLKKSPSPHIKRIQLKLEKTKKG